MNLRTIFKAQAVILLINGLGSLFLTSVFIQQAGWTPTADLITIGQFLGVVFIVNGIWSWRFPDIAKENLKSIGLPNQKVGIARHTANMNPTCLVFSLSNQNVNEKRNSSMPHWSHCHHIF